MSLPLPLLLVDVDGVLNPLPEDPAAEPAGYTAHVLRPRGFGSGLRVWLNPAHGAALRALGGLVDLVWATSWEEQANTMIGPLIGLSEPLPFVELGTPWLAHDRIWKRDRVAAWAGDRPFAWLDDAFEAGDDRWAASRTAAGSPTLLVHVAPRTGLLPEHLDRVRDWAEAPSC